MATLTVQDIAATGIAPTYAAADVAGDEFAFEQGAFVHVVNGSASSIDATVVSQYDPIPGVGPDDIVLTIAAGEEVMAGPFNTRIFSDEDGNVQITYTDVTDVTVAVLSI